MSKIVFTDPIVDIALLSGENDLNENDGLTGSSKGWGGGKASIDGDFSIGDI